VQVSVTDKGLSTSFEPASAILSGGVEVDVPESAAHAIPSPAGTTFTLYDTRADAEAGPNGPGVPYSFVFQGPAGELFSGAAVRLAGFQVGQVKSASLQFDSNTGQAYTTATAVLYPNRLHVAGPAGATDPAVWRGPTDHMVQVMIAHGYRAKLTQSPALIGARVIALEPIKTAPAASLGHGDTPLFPSAPEGGDIDDLTSQASQLLTKVNSVPIEAIGQDVRQITHRLNTLVSSPKVEDSLTHLDSTLAQVDQMVTQVKPQVGPLVTKLNTAADEISGMATAAKAVLSGDGASQDSSLTEAIKQLNDAARSVRSLADYLGRHPESLIKGKAKENPQ
jgi:paraquat-inducible protein B